MHEWPDDQAVALAWRAYVRRVAAEGQMMYSTFGFVWQGPCGSHTPLPSSGQPDGYDQV